MDDSPARIVPKDELLRVLKDAVSIPSVNPPGDEKPMVDYVEAYLKDAGFEVTRVHAGRYGRDTLIAILKGKTPDDGIIFTGHMDVVPVSSAERKRWQFPPFEPTVVGDLMYGRGSSDMKSGLMAAVVALCQLKRAGITPKRDIALVATIDEEDGMAGSRAVIGNELLRGFKWVVVCEPTQLECCTISRGRTYGELHIHGKTAHGSRPGSGTNAVLVANDIIDKMMQVDFADYKNEHGASFWQPLAIHAGVEPCVVPDTCVLKIDARLTTGHYPEKIWEQVDRIIKEVEGAHENLSISYNVIDMREPWITPQDSFVISLAKDACKQLDLPFVDAMFTGTTDGTPLRRDKRDVIIMGPGDLSCVHQENEHVSLSQYYKAFELYTTIMLSDK